MNPEHQAAEAKRLLEEIEPYLASVEADAIEAMLRADSDEGRRNGRDTVYTIRGLRTKLESAISAGKRAARGSLVSVA